MGCLWAGLCGFCTFVRGVFTVLCLLCWLLPIVDVFGFGCLWCLRGHVACCGQVVMFWFGVCWLLLFVGDVVWFVCFCGLFCCVWCVVVILLAWAVGCGAGDICLWFVLLCYGI